MRKRTLEELPDHIKSQCVIDEDTGCWVWQGKLIATGYGQMKARALSQNCIRVHTAMWMLTHDGERPPVLHHVCGVRACCNPGHLMPVASITEHNKLHTPPTCPKNHPVESLTTRPGGTRKGNRRCRDCERERASKRYADPVLREKHLLQKREKYHREKMEGSASEIAAALHIHASTVRRVIARDL